MKKYVAIVSFVIACGALSGCSDDGKLTKSTAEKILKTHSFGNRTIIIQFVDHSLNPFVSKELKLLKEAGFADYSYIPPGTEGYGLDGHLTDEGKKYVDRSYSGFHELITAKLELGQITGIQELPQTNSAIVEYTIKIVEPTPVGNVLHLPKELGQVGKGQATFKKYTDGWRLSTETNDAKK